MLQMHLSMLFQHNLFLWRLLAFFSLKISRFIIKKSHEKPLVGFATPFLSRQVEKICHKKKPTGSKVSAFFAMGPKRGLLHGLTQVWIPGWIETCHVPSI
jgi:hypothetical protein